MTSSPVAIPAAARAVRGQPTSGRHHRARRGGPGQRHHDRRLAGDAHDEPDHQQEERDPRQQQQRAQPEEDLLAADLSAGPAAVRLGGRVGHRAVALERRPVALERRPVALERRSVALERRVRRLGARHRGRRPSGHGTKQLGDQVVGLGPQRTDLLVDLPQPRRLRPGQAQPAARAGGRPGDHRESQWGQGNGAGTDTRTSSPYPGRASPVWVLIWDVSPPSGSPPERTCGRLRSAMAPG